MIFYGLIFDSVIDEFQCHHKKQYSNQNKHEIIITQRHYEKCKKSRKINQQQLLISSHQMKLLKRLKYHYFTQQIKSFKSKYLQDDYEILGFLGQGSTSRVFLGSNVLTNEKVVIKIFKSIPEDKIHRQIRVNNKINEYCEGLGYQKGETPILKLLDVVRNKGHGSYAFVFQYFPGSPMNMIPAVMVKENRFKYMQQILKAIDIVHSVNLIHRDIKPSNILITNKGAKLFDFGLSKQVGVDILKTNRFGTKCYYPPQVVFRMPQYSQKLDIWTCGLIFSELITMTKPILPYKSDLETVHQVVDFCDFNPKQDQQLIKRQIFELIPSKTHSKSFQSFINSLRKNRFILPELNNENFELLTETVKKMLKINPEMRPSANEVLSKLQPVFNIYQ